MSRQSIRTPSVIILTLYAVKEPMPSFLPPSGTLIRGVKLTTTPPQPASRQTTTPTTPKTHYLRESIKYGDLGVTLTSSAWLKLSPKLIKSVAYLEHITQQEKARSYIGVVRVYRNMMFKLVKVSSGHVNVLLSQRNETASLV